MKNKKEKEEKEEKELLMKSMKKICEYYNLDYNRYIKFDTYFDTLNYRKK